MEQTTCAKCDSKRVLEDVKTVTGAVDRIGELRVDVQKNPHAILFKGRIAVELVARVCADCGYTEFYALSPQRLLDAFEDRGETDEDDDGD